MIHLLERFIHFMFAGIGHFLGCWIIIVFISRRIGYFWMIFFRHQNIKKSGWPPKHCDADGDFEQEAEPSIF